ncbi:MAG TPA: carboxypeptidase-like regulatory domain-containing protein [Candidatus Polarisedimenticolaceae bacterium]|nr:carboxypeptidase-like regulatory domain-containing protein [Candidatus Polarisedimenticolaceae bacterium]
MTNGRAALALALGVVTSIATAGGALVTTPDGSPDPSVVVTCADPPSSAVSDGCRRVRCESRLWLAGEAPAGSPCALRPAVRLTTELPKGVGGTLRVTITPEGAKAPAWQSPGPVPPLPPGRYVVEAARADGSWRCHATLSFPKPRPETVFIPWREPNRVEGRVVDEAGKPRRAVPIRVDAAEGLGWRCDGNSKDVVSRDDGSFRLALDPEADAIVVAGGWDDPRGIAFAPAAPDMRLVPKAPHRATARVLDQEGRPVACRALLDLADAADRRIAPGAEGRCDAEGRVVMGPFASDSAVIDLRPVDALPTRLNVTASSGTALVDLGEVRVTRGATLRVTVRDDQRSPVEGATVVAESRVGLIIKRRTKTAADGVCVLTGLPSSGRVALSVEAPGFVRKSRTGVSPGGDEEVTLARAQPVRGRVVGPAGNGVAATVKASSVHGEPLDTVSSDGDGSFSLSSLPDEVVLLQAEASSAISDIVRVGERSGEITLALHDPDEIQGTVVDSSGVPIAGASVVLVRNVLGDPPEAGAIASTRSGDDGTFRLAAPNKEGAIVVATAPGFAAARAAPSISPTVVTLQPEARLMIKTRSSSPLMVVDAIGIPRVRPGLGRSVLVEHLAAGRCTVELGFSREKQVELAAGTTTEVEFDAGSRVSGRVTAGGRPSAQAIVAIASGSQGAATVSAGVRTDVGGAYAIDDVAPGPVIVSAVSAEGRAERRIEVPETGDVGADLEIVERRLRVLVRDRVSRKPIAGADVEAMPSGVLEFGSAGMSGGDQDLGWETSTCKGGCQSTVTGDDGVAVLTLVKDGAHDLSVEAMGFALWKRSVDVVPGTADLIAELAPGGPPTVRVILDTMPPLVAGALYCIQERSVASGEPIAGESVCQTFKPGPAVIAFRADDAGFARTAVDVPESGELTVTLSVPRAGRLVVPLSPGDRSVRIFDDQGATWNLPYGLGWPRCGLEGGRDAPSNYVCHEMPPGTYTVEVDGRRRTPVVVSGGDSVTAN